MCGIAGFASSIHSVPSPAPGTLLRMRDLLAHRGPDGFGDWASSRRHIQFAHRRLAVLDPSLAGAQPFVLTRNNQTLGVLVYNGEIYNDADLRAHLTHCFGGHFHTRCDTETLALALAHLGTRALPMLRGMFAFAWYDAQRETLLLARDPLGIKPLYWWRGQHAGHAELAFASEIRPLLLHPHISSHPDLITVSSYLTTIRTTLGTRTLYRDIQTLEPGEHIHFDLRSPSLPESKARTLPLPESAAAACSVSHSSPGPTGGGVAVLGDGGGALEPLPVGGVGVGLASHPTTRARATTTPAQPLTPVSSQTHDLLATSISLHLRSDVPTCSLLSGGLDSTILASIASRHSPALHTYCSGARSAEPSDLDFAREAAAALHTHHTEAPISRELFLERWQCLIDSAHVPLSTPNEVAINEVARILRAQGHVVALSGEGADELFAGYEGPMASAAEFVAQHPTATPRDAALFQLTDAAWAPLEFKPALFLPDICRAIEHDTALIDSYTATFQSLERDDDPDPLQTHLRFTRRINLAGLLLRLDSATMRESVEGRTPFADIAVAAFAESLPMPNKFAPATATTPVRTKIALRQAFAAEIPPSILSRPKASFPLPFADWIDAMAPRLLSSSLAQQLFTPAALHHVAQQPKQLWRLAWPMLNLAMWMP